MRDENYPAHDLAPELDDLSVAYARLQAENAALRAELLSRAEKDAEDTHRLQQQYDHLYRQFDSLQKWVARGMALHPTPPIVLEGVSAALWAELEAARAVVAAMRQIDRHVIGACESPINTGSFPEPCDECGEMREIAAQALKTYDEVTKARTR